MQKIATTIALFDLDCEHQFIDQEERNAVRLIINSLHAAVSNHFESVQVRTSDLAAKPAWLAANKLAWQGSEIMRYSTELREMLNFIAAANAIDTEAENKVATFKILIANCINELVDQLRERSSSDCSYTSSFHNAETGYRFDAKEYMLRTLRRCMSYFASADSERANSIENLKHAAMFAAALKEAQTFKRKVHINVECELTKGAKVVGHVVAVNVSAGLVDVRYPHGSRTKTAVVQARFVRAL